MQFMEYEKTRAVSKRDLSPFIAPALEKFIARRDIGSFERIEEENEKKWEKVEQIAIVEDLYSARVVFDANPEGNRIGFERLSFHIITPGLLTKTQLQKLRKEVYDDWEKYHFENESITWDEFNRELDANSNQRTDAIGNIYRIVHSELVADNRLDEGNLHGEYKSESVQELLKWWKKIETVKPFSNMLEKYDLIPNEIRIKNYDKKIQIVKVILMAKTRDEGYFGGLEVLSYETERIREERKVKKIREMKKLST